MPALHSNDPTIDVGRAIEAAYANAKDMVEPKPSDILLCSYPDTMDACAAAWVIYKIAKRDKIATEFVNTGSTTKLWLPEPKDIVDRHWVAICDGGVPPSTYGKTLLTFARDSSGFVKPPIPYRSWKRTPPFGISDITLVGKTCGVHDAKKSLCRMVWEFFCGEYTTDKPPRMLSHIDDFTTGTLKYNESKEIAAAISSYPKELALYDKLAVACEDRRRREAMVAAGQGIIRYIDQLKR